tara:strand:+ start:232 stop:1242 length:1011 start_codon:yes stop_codon:yes gene_type:complete
MMMANGGFFMADLTHRDIQANGINIHCVAAGDGPLVILCHGFPESWYSWRHQLPILADAGYRAIALDMRGYGGTSQPEMISSYNLSKIIGDVVSVVNALDEKQAVVVGHDWGGPVAWYSALMRPDIFRAVAVLSVPYNPPMQVPEELILTKMMAENAGEKEYYRSYFQEPGIAELDLEADIRHSMLGFFYSVSGDIVKDRIRSIGWDGHFPKGESMSSLMPIPNELPHWLTQEDLDHYVKAFQSSGFRGGLNWYRNIDSLPGILAPFIGTTINQPALYMYGEHDLIGGNDEISVQSMRTTLPNLTEIIKMEGAGHWLQQERPEEVNEQLLKFLAGL